MNAVKTTVLSEAVTVIHEESSTFLVLDSDNSFQFFSSTGVAYFYKFASSTQATSNYLKFNFNT